MRRVDVSDKTCFLCEIIAGRKPAHRVWSDVEFVALLDHYPMTAGHLLLVPRVHIDSVFDLPSDLYERLFARARDLAGPVARAAGAPRTGIAVEGFGVPHAHVHLVPVWHGNDLDPCRQAVANDDELLQAAEHLRGVLVEAGMVRTDGRGATPRTRSDKE